ncbi:fibrinogen-binding protein [Rhizobium sullae]|uniref:fibrinogen-binding protein n=1 Tax=Rhizobium sullae TaxID=50338 RepID=UPI000B355B63|nr:fibrinogen-binding protein [Rhizobium sullae]
MTNYNYPSGGDETETNVGALADGFANTAINDTDVDDGSTGYVGGIANGDNRNNTDNSLDVDVDSKIDVDANNGDNRDNEYDWSYDNKEVTVTDIDTDIKTTTITDTDVKTDYDWSYDSKSYSDNDVITSTKTETDIKTITDTDIKTITDTNSHNTTTTDSFNKTDTDFAVLEDVKDFDNLGIAGGNLNIGDNFSFTLDVDNILNSSLGAGGNGFSAVQANHLADQDSAWNIRMDNSGAQNHLNADGGKAFGSEGIDINDCGWEGGAGDDVTGASTTDASAIIANSGFHLEVVQGANLLSNAFESNVGSNVAGDDTDAGT